MEEKDWKLLSWVRRAKNRRKVISYLHQIGEPRTPSEIGSNIGISMNNASRSLRQMVDNESYPDLVRCINPEANYDRMYTLTEKGEKIARKLEELEEK